MPDSLALPAIALVAAALVALALAWPQGEGAPSPPPFGHSLAPVAPSLLAPPQPASAPPASTALRGREPAAASAPHPPA